MMLHYTKLNLKRRLEDARKKQAAVAAAKKEAEEAINSDENQAPRNEAKNEEN